MTVRAMIPSTSSMMAAPKMAFPALVFSLPISFRVSTEILTLVAVRITPIKMFCSMILADALEAIIPGLLKNQATPKPPASGTSTPNSAMIKEALPLFFSSSISVSRPAQNINTITPISDTSWINSVCFKIPKQAGPSSSPASSAPTTWGILTFLVRSPNTLVLSNISARSSK